MSTPDCEPSVAAVVATRNRPEYVRDAVTSACEQTYDALEVVVVDGSDGNQTASVIEEVQSTYPSVTFTYIHNDSPRGLPAARNQAVEVTDADYLAFLDDDDRWHPEKITRQMSCFHSGPDDLALVHTGFVARDNSDDRLFEFTPEYDAPAYPQILVKNIVATPSTVVVRREAFEEIGGFDEQLRYCEDWDFYIRLARNNQFTYIIDPLIDHMYHEETMKNDLETLFTYRKQVLEKHTDELQRHGLADRAWSHHYRLVGERYLQAEQREQAKAAYRRLWQRNRDIKAAIMVTILSTLPIEAALPTIQLLSTLQSRIGAPIQTASLNIRGKSST